MGAAVNASPQLVSGIEKDSRPASPEFCESLHRAYRLTPDERRHLKAMVDFANNDVSRWAWKDDAETVLKLPWGSETILEGVKPHAAAWVDSMGRVLACNEVFSTAFRGLDQADSILHWFLRDPRSRVVMLDWENELRLAVAWFRALMGQTGNPVWAQTVLAELSHDEDFARFWSLGEVAYGRYEHNPYMHMYDRNTGEVFSMLVQLTAAGVHQGPMQFYLGMRLPYAGGPELLRKAGMAAGGFANYGVPGH